MTPLNRARQQGQSERALARLRWLHALASLCALLFIDLVWLAAVAIWPDRLGSIAQTGLLVLSGAVVTLIAGNAWIALRRWRDDPAAIAESLGATRLDSLGDPLHRRLQNLLEELALSAQVGVPRAFVLEGEDRIDALTVGMDPNRSVVMATRGALNRLTRSELQGLLAHEIAHLVAGDVGLNTWLMGLNTGLNRLSMAGAALRLRAAAAWRDRSRRPLDAAVAPLQALAGIGVSVLGQPLALAARASEAGVGWHRDYAADALAVDLTGQTLGLGNALRKVLGGSSQAAPPGAQAAPSSSTRAALPGLSMLWFSGACGGADAVVDRAVLSQRLERLLGEPARSLSASVLTDEAHHREAALPDLDLESKPAHPPADRPRRIRLDASAPTALDASSGDRTVGNHRTAAPRPHPMIALEPAAPTAVMRLVRATREPEGAAALLVALLDAPGRPAPAWDRNWLVAGQRFEALQATVAELTPDARKALRWPLLELAVPRLGPLSDAMRQSLWQTARGRVQTEGAALPLDWIYLVLIGIRLDAQAFGPRRTHAGEAPDARSVRIVFALVAQDGGIDEVRMDRAANAAIRELALPSVGGSAGELSLAALEGAVERLRGLPPLARPVLLRHLVAMQARDAAPSTAELLRILGVAIDVPQSLDAGIEAQRLVASLTDALSR